MVVVQGAVWLVSLILVALTVLPLWRSPRWWVRLWDYPRLQLAGGLIVAIALQLALLPFASEWPLLLASLVCLAWQVSWIYPYTPLWRHEVTKATAGQPATETVRLMVANVLQDNRRAADFLARVEAADPDILLAVETNGWWDEQIAPLKERYPHRVEHPLENTYGMHLFSRLPLVDTKLQDRVSENIPSIFTRFRLPSGRLVNLHCLHPEPPQPGNDVAERNAELILVGREVAEARRPTIVCGDLNDVAWSHTNAVFKRISGLLDPRIGRGLFPTFHADYPIARWPLDHFFHDASFRLKRLAVLPHFGSDHFPVLLEVVHDASAVFDHEIPEADAEDHEEAAEMVREGREAAASA